MNLFIKSTALKSRSRNLDCRFETHYRGVSSAIFANIPATWISEKNVENSHFYTLFVL